MAHFNSFRKILSSIIIACFLASCTTDIDWEKQLDTLINGQSYVIPIGETTLTLNEILNQLDSIHELVEPGENYIYLKYNDTVVWNFRNITDFQNIVSVNEDYLIPAGPIPANSSIQVPDLSQSISLDFNTLSPDQRIDRTEINKAKLEITVSKSDGMNIDPSNIKVTTFFSNELTFAPGGDVEMGAGSTIEFKPTVFGTPEIRNLNPFTILSPNKLSSINLTIRVEIIAGNTALVIPPDSKITVNYRLFDVDVKVFYGILKPTIANNDQDKIVDMAKYILQLPANGVFKIAEPILSFDLFNNSGIKINLGLDSIKAFKSNDPTFKPVYALFDGQKSTSKIIDRIQNFGDEPVKTSYVLDHTLANGEVSHFFDRFPLPDLLYYKFKLANARVDTDPLDFATPNSNLKAHINVKIPLKLNAGSSFELVDTLENIDMESLIDLQVVDQMMLVLKVTNNLPLKGELSLKFLDVNKLPINDLDVLSESIIKAPQIDENGLVVGGQSVDSDLKVIVASSQLTKLRLAKSIVYTIKVESEENRKITLQKDNFIKLKLGKFSRAE